jgi:hypothetical protein
MTTNKETEKIATDFNNDFLFCKSDTDRRVPHFAAVDLISVNFRLLKVVDRKF